MRVIKEKDPKRNGYYSVMKVEDFEYVNPIQNTSETIIESMSLMVTNTLMFAKENNKLPNMQVIDTDSVIRKVALEKGIAIWEEQYKKILSQNLPENIFEILESNSKKEQIKLLKGLSLTTDELMLFIFKAWENYGFAYSMYESEHQHKGVNENELPRFAHKEEDGSITKVGATNLTDGSIKHAIEYRTVTIAKFLDKGNIWHCFFYTYKSLNGMENLICITFQIIGDFQEKKS